MANEKDYKPNLRIELTPEQRKQIKQSTGAEVTVLELPSDQLEKRTPGTFMHDIYDFPGTLIDEKTK
jgi:hypothetical protein